MKTMELDVITDRKQTKRSQPINGRDVDLIDLNSKKRQARIKEKRIKQAKQKRKRKRRARIRILCFFLSISLCFLVAYLILTIVNTMKDKDISVLNLDRYAFLLKNDTKKPEMTEELLTVNEFSRPGTPIGKVKNIFVHYTANPGTNAMQNRSYFENLGMTGETSASAHFVIGYEGEIVQCIPLKEVGYAVKQRNYDSISIECCYLSEDGKFTDETYQSLLHLSAWLLKKYRLTPQDMRRHYDEGGKLCPKYYVEHEDAWNQFIDDLEKYVE